MLSECSYLNIIVRDSVVMLCNLLKMSDNNAKSHNYTLFPVIFILTLSLSYVTALRCSLPLPIPYGSCFSRNGITLLGFQRSCACFLGYDALGDTNAVCRKVAQGQVRWDKDPPTCKGMCSLEYFSTNYGYKVT